MIPFFSHTSHPAWVINWVWMHLTFFKGSNPTLASWCVARNIPSMMFRLAGISWLNSLTLSSRERIVHADLAHISSESPEGGSTNFQARASANNLRSLERLITLKRILENAIALPEARSQLHSSMAPSLLALLQHFPHLVSLLQMHRRPASSFSNGSQVL